MMVLTLDTPCSALAAAPFFLMSISNSLAPLGVWLLAVRVVFTSSSVLLVGGCGLETSCDCTSAAG